MLAIHQTDTKFDTKADDFRWIPLDIFEQKYSSASSIRCPHEEVSKLKTAILKNVNFQKNIYFDPSHYMLLS